MNEREMLFLLNYDLRLSVITNPKCIVEYIDSRLMKIVIIRVQNWKVK